MKGQLDLARARNIALRTCDREIASLDMLIKLGLAWKYALAPNALEVVLLKVEVQGARVWTIKVTAWLQAMLVL